jgi:hypothetical protein
MKSLKEIKKNKEALMADNELNLKGQYLPGGATVGNGTQWYGPYQEPSRTYVDGMPWGNDGLSGNLFGDSWNVAHLRTIQSNESDIATPTYIYLTQS